MQMRLRTRIIILAASAVAITIFLLLGLLRWEDEEMVKGIGEQWRSITTTNMVLMVQDARTLCLAANLSVERRLDGALDRLHRWMTDAGKFDWKEPGTEQMIHTSDASGSPLVERSVLVPDMKWGNEEIEFTREWDARGSLVDDLQASSGAMFSLYARMTEAGDMVCVASSARDTDGLRKTGRLIPVRLADGAPSPSLMRVLGGRSAVGVSFVGDEWILSKWEPLKNEMGRVSGMVEVSLPMPALDVVKNSLTQTRLGASGDVWIVGGEGGHRGQYILAHDERLANDNLLNMRSTEGRLVGQAILNRALKLTPGETAFEEAEWQDAPDSEPRRGYLAFTYFAPWDWVIGVTVYDTDVEAAQRRVQTVLDRLFQHMIGAGVVVLVLVLIFSIWTGRQLARPIEEMARTAGNIASGDLRTANESWRHIRRSGVLETERLGNAFRQMTESLTNLIRQMQHSGEQVTASGSQVSLSTRELERVTEEQAGAATRATESTRAISSTAQELAHTMTRVVDAANDAARVADESRKSLQDTETRMHNLMEASETIATRLSTMSEKTGNIGGIVTTITKVADQTNLLSINAAIEAEKAGEYGRGFSVVSREIRSLADQTAISSLHIERMVSEMGSAVTSGVMEMDQFVERVREGIAAVQNVGSRLERLIGQVQALTQPLDAMLQDMRTQSRDAEHIRDAMEQLETIASATRENIRELSGVSSHLSNTVQSLQKEVTRFVTE